MEYVGVIDFDDTKSQEIRNSCFDIKCFLENKGS